MTMVTLKNKLVKHIHIQKRTTQLLIGPIVTYIWDFLNKDSPKQEWSKVVCILGQPWSFICVSWVGQLPFRGERGPFAAAAAHRGTFRDTWVLEENGKQLSQELGFRYQPASPGRLAKASVLCWLTASARIPSLVYLPNVCKKTHTTSSNGVHCTYLSVMKYSVNLP